MEKKRLNETVQGTGAYLLKWLEDTAFKSGNQIENIRGKGTLLAFDVNPKNKSLNMHKALKEKGVNTGLSLPRKIILLVKLGEKTIGIRPALTLSRKEADKFLDALQQVLH